MCRPDNQAPQRQDRPEPAGGFQVVGGEALSIRLDIDAGKSIQLHQAGNSEKCIFRPVIFVDIEPVHAVERCPDVLKAKSRNILYNGNKVRNGFVLELPGEGGTVNVIVDNHAVIFDINAEVGDINAVQLDDTVYVRGPLTAAGNLTASLVVVGDVLKLEGTVASVAADQTRPRQFDTRILTRDNRICETK